MNRILTVINFCGVLALAVLCAFQWRTNGQLSNDCDRLEDVRARQAIQIDTDEKSLKDKAGELDDLRGRLSISQAAANTAEEKLRASSHEVELLTAQRDRLKANLQQWIDAVAARDAAIKQAGEQVQKLAAERRDAQQRLNDLTVKYNSMAKQ